MKIIQIQRTKQMKNPMKILTKQYWSHIQITFLKCITTIIQNQSPDIITLQSNSNWNKQFCHKKLNAAAATTETAMETTPLSLEIRVGTAPDFT